MNRAQGNLSVFFHPKMSNSSPLSCHLSNGAFLVPETAAIQGSPAHYVSPLVHDKPNLESFHPDRGEEYVNENTSQAGEQSAMGQWLKNKLNWVLPAHKHWASSTSDTPDVQPMITTSLRDAVSTVLSTSTSHPLPVSESPARGTSCADVIMNEPEPPILSSTGLREHIGHPSCIGCHQPSS